MSSEPEAARPEPRPPAEGEEKSSLATLAVQLFVIPLALVLFCVALGGLFMWLTAERKDFEDYVGALRSSSGTQRSQQARYLLNYIQESKRWQGIFDVTARISADREKFLAQHPQAVAELVGVFEEAQGQDPRTRRYLALILGLLGSPEAVPALENGLNDSDPETVKNCLWALGSMRVNAIAPKVIELTRSPEPSVRLMAVYVLGSLDHPQARELLMASLNDADQLVRWNAAFGLASRGDAAAVPVLKQLLDKNFVDRFSEVTPENRQLYRVAAVNWLGKLQGEQARPMLEQVSSSDADLRVRNAALQEINRLKR